MVPNDTANVSVAKGVAGGYLLSAPIETAPSVEALSDLSYALGEEFENLGYVSADGITESESASSQEERDIDGNLTGTALFDRTETVRFRLVELRPAAVREAHGHGSVDVEPDLMVVHHDGLPKGHRTYVAELVLKDGRRWRKVIPDGQVTGVGDLSLSSAGLAAREVTVSCNATTWTRGGGEWRDTVVDFVELHDPDAIEPVPGSARLARLYASVPMAPEFRPWVGQYALVTHARGLMVRAHLLDPDASMSAQLVGGTTPAICDGEDCYVDTYDPGDYELRITVSNPVSGEEGTYSVAIAYEPEDSEEATLAYARIWQATLTPMWSATTYEYRTTVTSRFGTVHVTPTDSAATVMYALNGGQEHTAYPNTGNGVNWVEGENALVLTVTLGGATTRYTLLVTYEPA